MIIIRKTIEYIDKCNHIYNHFHNHIDNKKFTQPDLTSALGERLILHYSIVLTPCNSPTISSTKYRSDLQCISATPSRISA